MREAQVVGRGELQRARFVDRVDEARDFGQARLARRRHPATPGNEPEASVVWTHQQRLDNPSSTIDVARLVTVASAGRSALSMRATGTSRTGCVSVAAVSCST